MNASRSPITVQPRIVFLALCLIIALLAGGHLAALTMKQLGHERVFGLVRLVDMDRERNLPTLFSTCMFLVSSLLCFGVWRARRLEMRPVNTWLFLSGLLLFLAVDECCQVHEYFKDPTRDMLGTSRGFFGPAWVIPYGIAACLLFAVLIPFFIRQEKPIRRLLAISAGTFMAGAVGLEMLAGKYIALSEAKLGDEFSMSMDLKYGLFVAAEESLEMLGLAISIFALMTLLQKTHGGLVINLPASDPVASSEKS